jgi:LPS-assembly protein
MRSLALLLAVLALVTVPAQAQAPPPPTGKKAPRPLLTDDGETHVHSEVQERVAKGHYRFSGFVDFVVGDLRVQADVVDVYEEPRPDGKLSRRAEAQGEVVFFQGEQRLSGTHGTLDLDTGKGKLFEARGFMDPGVFVEADEIERVSAKMYRVKGGRFTSCFQPHPRWSFTSHFAKVKLGSYILATAVDFHVFDVPTPIFLPVFYYPINENQRSTGFLIPQPSQSTIKGFGLSESFFWAMSRSFDQTFTVENFSLLGTGFGHEFRYMLPTPSSGLFRTYALHKKEDGTWDYSLDWDATQALPSRVMAKVSVHQYSSTSFQGQIQESLDLASSRSEQISVSVSRSLPIGSLQLLAMRSGTFYTETTTDATTTPPTTTTALTESFRERLPELHLGSPNFRLGHTGLLFDYDLRADELGFGNETKTDRFSRFDAYADLSRPFSMTFLNITPRIRERYTRYEERLSLTDSTVFDPTPLTRPYFEAAVDVRGPMFSRVFLTPGNFYAERFKHEIGPELGFSYVTRIDNFLAVPQFDGVDSIVGTERVDYGLDQHLFAKRRDESNRLQTFDVLSWTIKQSWYSEVTASQYDPNYLSSNINPANLPSATPTPVPAFHHYSPVLSKVRFNPDRRVTTSFDTEYNTYGHGFSRVSLGTTLSFNRLTFEGNWSRSARLDSADQLILDTNTLRGSGLLRLIPDKLSVRADGTYDMLQKLWLNLSASLRYDVQCCGIVLDYTSFDFNTVKDSRFSVRLLLANVGSTSSFNNQDALGTPGAYGGR